MNHPVGLVRPDRATALAYAEQVFRAGDRVDINSLAEILGVGRTTLYRWVGARDQVLDEVLASLTSVTYATCIESAEGAGIDRALDAVERFLAISSTFEPLRTFVQREPELALRIMLRSGGRTPESGREGVLHALTAALPHRADLFIPQLIDAINQVGVSLVWVPLAIGEPPAIERAISLGRMLLETLLASPPDGGARRIV